MKLVYACPVCQTTNLAEVSAQQLRLGCSNCAWKRDIPADSLSGGRATRCLACGNEDLWRQKDFPQVLGLVMVATGAVLATIFWAYFRPELAIGVLLLFAAIDLVLFAVMPDILVCYRCKARHRQADMDEQHPRFNLELAERYRQEAIRLAEAEKSKRSGDAV